MNWVVIAGVLLTAAGAYLTWYGGQKDSRAIEDKIDKFREEVAQARAEPGRHNSEKIERLNDEFSEWADSLSRDHRTKKLELERNRLSRRAASIEQVRALRDKLQFAIDALESSLVAYGRVASKPVETKLPQLTDEALLRPLGVGSGKVVFAEGPVWTIDVLNSGNGEYFLLVSFHPSQKDLEGGSSSSPENGRFTLSVREYRDERKFRWRASTSGEFIPPDPLLAGDERSEDTYQKEVALIVRKLVEVQVLSFPTEHASPAPVASSD